MSFAAEAGADRGQPGASGGRAQAETDCVRAKGFPNYHHTGVYAGCEFKPGK